MDRNCTERSDCEVCDNIKEVKSYLKTQNMTQQNFYLAPEVSVLEMSAEGVLCNSVNGGNLGDNPWDGESDN